MTKEVLKGKLVSGCKERDEAMRLEFQKGNTKSESMLRFQKQQANNLQIKETMATELAAMELSADAVNQILHLEDELPI